MIDHKQIQLFAARLLASPNATEVEVRRSVSALYYGLFHRLAAAGATVFLPGGELLSSQAARAFSHGTMLDVCKAYCLPSKNQLPSPLDRLVPKVRDKRLVDVAQAFIDLQDARHSADYDVFREFPRVDGLDWLTQAEHAHWMLDQVQDLPETIVFLTALLLHDRWKRRG